MYDSDVTVNQVVSILESEVDIASAISKETCMRVISSLEQLLYTDIIKSYRSIDVPFDGTGFRISDIQKREDEKSVIFDDIVKVYCGADEIVKSGVIAAWQFENDKPIYWQDGSSVQVRVMINGADSLHVIYKARPEIKKNEEDTIKVPYEWLEMVLSKLRGEAYKIAGDDAQAAKWLNDYNSQLESFKAWVAERQKWFGE